MELNRHLKAFPFFIVSHENKSTSYFVSLFQGTLNKWKKKKIWKVFAIFKRVVCS